MPPSVLTLGHSPDPDDAFMWWPITGMVLPDGTPVPGGSSRPAIQTGRFAFRAVPESIELLNQRAASAANLDITAVSARAYADVANHYIITSCGASFGDGYGPKLVVREDSPLRSDWSIRAHRPVIGIPGTHTTAFLALSLLIAHPFDYVEMPFDKITSAVAQGRVGAGLIIHEAQLTFADLGLRQIADLGAWWKDETGLPLPLGLNTLRRDLEDRFGPGTFAELSGTLRRSIDYALAERTRSLEYAMTFAMSNTTPGEPTIPRARVDEFVSMYVNGFTRDMGDLGRAAIERLLSRGAEMGLCPAVDRIEIV